MVRREIKPIVMNILLILVFSNFIIHGEPNDDIPITPNDEFFTQAIDFFDIDPETYRLAVTGEVANPLNLTLEEIKAMPVTSEIVRLTCIGYKTGETSLTGVANWTGVRLFHILNMSQINLKTAKDISLHTPDRNPWAYSTSLTLEEAFWGDVILAYEMNGEPLPKDHGYPIRLVCPRFFGYKWIKWVAYINVTTEDYKGFYENGGYEDSPYVDVDLPIYYSPVESDIRVSNSASWTGLNTIFSAIITGVVVRSIFGKRRIK
ncbi:MAG: molybdopterin-dependent oxidoreductase [Candidatus Hodarchaeales archaeon]|jgi:DMSO/TMAO reductase YedYZ molybdopterin-dependent catalytic subunit